MKLRANKCANGFIGNYTVSIGSKEAREAGFLNEDGSSKPIKKTVEAGKIVFEVDTETE